MYQRRKLKTIKTIQLLSGKEMPILGQGTWRMGEKADQKKAEIYAYVWE